MAAHTCMVVATTFLTFSFVLCLYQGAEQQAKPTTQITLWFGLSWLSSALAFVYTCMHGCQGLGLMLFAFQLKVAFENLNLALILREVLRS